MDSITTVELKTSSSRTWASRCPPRLAFEHPNDRRARRLSWLRRRRRREDDAGGDEPERQRPAAELASTCPRTSCSTCSSTSWTDRRGELPTARARRRAAARARRASRGARPRRGARAEPAASRSPSSAWAAASPAAPTARRRFWELLRDGARRRRRGARRTAGTSTRSTTPTRTRPARSTPATAASSTTSTGFDAAVLRHLAARGRVDGPAAAARCWRWPGRRWRTPASPRTVCAAAAPACSSGISADDYAHARGRARRPARDRRLPAPPATPPASRPAACPTCSACEGPSMAVDTACSSSLVAVHLAVPEPARRRVRPGARRRRQPDAAAGDDRRASSKARMLAPRRPLQDLRRGGRRLRPRRGLRHRGAQAPGATRAADGDRVLAVVRGSAVNQDGRSSGLTVPNAAAQEAVVRARARRRRRRRRGEVDYVEAHGTGTPLGDPIEVRGARPRSSARGRATAPLLIGSVKTNIGHLEAAAGVAGLIKAALVLQHGEVPPHLHLHEPNPHVDWDAAPARGRRREPTPLASATAALAGVSSFGISGTNAHVVLEAPPAAARPPRGRPDGAGRRCSSRSPPAGAGAGRRGGAPGRFRRRAPRRRPAAVAHG